MNDDRRPDRDELLEERLLDGLLSADERDEREWARLCADPEARRKLTELEGFLATCRDVFEPARQPGSGDLVRRILESTTREDPGWRGDLRLVRGFVAARWKASFFLRVAAASLILHLAALPLLAYFGFAPRSPEFTLTFSPRSVPEYGDPREPEHEVELPELDELPEVRDVPVQDELAIENALRWARHHLAAGGPPDAGPGTSAVTRALAQRGSYLRGGRWDGEHPSGLPASGSDRVAMAVWVEHLLDRFVLERRLPDGLAAALALVGSPEEAVNAGVRDLELRALLRAQAYGILDQGETERVERLLGADDHEPVGWDPLAAGCPLDRGYLDALRAAAGTELAMDPVGQAWLRWGE